MTTPWSQPKVLDSLSSSLRKAIMKIRGSPLVDEKVINEVIEDLENALLAGDVKLDLVLDVTARVREKALKDDIPMGVSRTNYTIKVLYDELTALLGKRYTPLRLNPDEKSVLMFIGIQGSGKTTSIGKVANYYKKRGMSVGVVGGDTFRPGALAQLQQLLAPISVEVYGEEKEKKALKVIKNGLKHFQAQKSINLVLIDTTGRHKEETSLLKEMAEIGQVANPTEIILVVDATIGQQAWSQADAFNRATPFGSIILSKLDGSAKGGGAISAVATSGAQIRFYGEGERIEDLVEFNPTRFVGSLLGMGDIEGLVTSVNEMLDAESTAELTQAFKKGKLTLRHFKIQMEKTYNPSGFGKMLSKIPIISGMMPQSQLDAEAQQGVKRFVAICNSMTGAELDDARIIRGSRILRIARGSGTTPQEVRELLKQFNMMTKQFKRMRKMRGPRGAPGSVPPGMEGLFG